MVLSAAHHSDRLLPPRGESWQPSTACITADLCIDIIMLPPLFVDQRGGADLKLCIEVQNGPKPALPALQLQDSCCYCAGGGK